VDQHAALRILDEHIVGGKPVEAFRHVAPPGDNKLVQD
jgi:(2Fe-2S) ferredoxin